MTRGEAVVARHLAKTRRQRAQHPVARGMTVAIVDLLEMIDIAKRDAQRLALVARLDRGGDQLAFERAAVGQTGEMIDIGLAARAGEAFAQAVDLKLAARHRRFDLFDPAQHRARQVDHLREFLRPGERLDLVADCAAVIAGLALRIACGLRKAGERVFELFRKLFERSDPRIAIGIVAQDRVEPTLVDRLAAGLALHQCAGKFGAATRQRAAHRSHVGRGHFKIVAGKERADIVEQFGSCSLGPHAGGMCPAIGFVADAGRTRSAGEAG